MGAAAAPLTPRLGAQALKAQAWEAQVQEAQVLEALASALPEAPMPAGFSDSQAPTAQAQTPAPGSEAEGQKTERERAEEQLRREERQRTLGVVPSFNIAYDQNAPPLSPGEKFRLAFHTMKDPFTIGVAAINAGYNQATDGFPGYGQGAAGFGKRFGAAYADSADGTLLGNAVLPVLMKEDPRYFRRGTGSIRSRLLYAISTTVWCRRDNGTHGPNYANVLGNLAAGGVANLYYPASDRGAGLTFERGLVVTAEGTLGGLADEFLPDLTRHFLHRDVSGHRVPASTTPAVAVP